MTESQKDGFLKKIKKIVLDVDPEGVLRDARSAGLNVTRIEDFRKQAHNYWRMEDIMNQYVNLAARYSAIGGATSGIGGIATAVTLGTAMLHI